MLTGSMLRNPAKIKEKQKEEILKSMFLFYFRLIVLFYYFLKQNTTYLQVYTVAFFYSPPYISTFLSEI